MRLGARGCVARGDVRVGEFLHFYLDRYVEKNTNTPILVMDVHTILTRPPTCDAVNLAERLPGGAGRRGRGRREVDDLQVVHRAWSERERVCTVWRRSH